MRCAIGRAGERRRMLALLAVAGATAASLSACGGLACTEIGWDQEVLAVVDPSVGDVDSTTLCALEVGCVDGTEEPDGRWRFDVGLETPAEVTITGRDAEGAVVVERDLAVRWTETDAPNGPGCDNASVADELRLG